MGVGQQELKDPDRAICKVTMQALVNREGEGKGGGEKEGGRERGRDKRQRKKKKNRKKKKRKAYDMH